MALAAVRIAQDAGGARFTGGPILAGRAIFTGRAVFTRGGFTRRSFAYQRGGSLRLDDGQRVAGRAVVAIAVEARTVVAGPIITGPIITGTVVTRTIIAGPVIAGWPVSLRLLVVVTRAVIAPAVAATLAIAVLAVLPITILAITILPVITVAILVAGPVVALLTVLLLRLTALRRLPLAHLPLAGLPRLGRLAGFGGGQIGGLGLRLGAFVLEIDVEAGGKVVAAKNFAGRPGRLHGAQQAEIVFGVLEIVLSKNAVAGRRGVTGELLIFLEDVLGVATHFRPFGAVGIERPVGVLGLRLAAAATPAATAAIAAALTLHTFEISHYSITVWFFPRRSCSRGAVGLCASL